MVTFFGNFPDYLSALLGSTDDTRLLMEQDMLGFSLTSVTPGVIEIQPKGEVPGAPYQLILSSGIHGNETAPIELLNELLNLILNRELTPMCPVMLIFGNLEAMRAHTRFIDQNLNRLFCGKHRSLSPDRETLRAKELEDAVTRFLDTSMPCIHYDLHTAIRPSLVEKFALYPFVPERVQAGRGSIPEVQLGILSASGIQAVILQNTPASTFSAFTARTFDAQSFTVELGKVQPFGQNDLHRLTPLKTTLIQLLQNAPLLSRQEIVSPEQYEVCHEILHKGVGFELNVPDDVQNFTAYPAGTEIWNAPNAHYRTLEKEEFIVFPNPKVPEGQRAGLMLKKRVV